MNARRWRRGLWLLGFACLLLPVLRPPPLHSGAYVQDVTATGAVVAMITAAPVALGLLVFDEAGTAIAVPPEQGPGRRHAFAVAGLQPARSYRFEVRDEGGEVVDRGTIRTPPADDRARVQFAVVGDSGGQPWWVSVQQAPLFWLPARWDWLPVSGTVAAIGARIAAAEPQFVLHVGDLVYPWGHQQHYSPCFFRPFAEVLRHAPLYAALGNHDVMDDGGRQLLSNLYLPRGETTGDERCYTFGWGSVRVFVVDLSQPDPGVQVDRTHPSVVFLERELPLHEEPWFVVASHYPLHSASRQRDRPDLLLHVLPLLRQHGVDLYLAGHDHTYQRFGDGSDLVQVVSGGGGKSLYEVLPHPQVKVALAEYHWCSVEVVGPSLTLRARGLDGALLDTVQLEQRPAGERFARVQAVNPARAARIAALQ